MSLRQLRWFVFLGPVGAIAMVVPFMRPLWPLSVFLIFILLWSADERGEKNLGRAAAVTFTANLFALVATFALLTIPHKDFAAYSAWLMGYALIFLYLLNVITFVAAYAYYDIRGL